ncbi:MAG TPA: ion transporter [Burkholderiaceae bacterium]|nr:ion transporter [Burkholderiaceae bacterium]
MNKTKLKSEKPNDGLRLKLYTIIFEADTRAGMLFDRWLIVLILASIAVVLMASVASLNTRFGSSFIVLEWLFTLLFTVEYALRLYCSKHPLRYALSFYGLVDLISILPTYLALLFPEAHALIDVRILRLMRILRIFKLTAYLAEYQALGHALKASARKILIFLSVVMMVVLILGTLLYVVEGPEHGFTSIPTAIYWAISTITTVGYGDIAPKTDLGRFIASIIMLMGWGTLAVPTGIVTSEMTTHRYRSVAQPPTTRSCPECMSEGHLPDAHFCKDCGSALPPYQA